VPEAQARMAAYDWVASLQNRDGGFPTFCRGWGTLPFDRSGSDLTAHTLRAIEANDVSNVHIGPPARGRTLAHLSREKRPDGSWLPLWFGNQHAKDDINPVYGTARVLAAYRDLADPTKNPMLGVMQEITGEAPSRWPVAPECQRGVTYLVSVQNADG